MLKKLLTYICMFLVGMTGFYLLQVSESGIVFENVGVYAASGDTNDDIQKSINGGINLVNGILGILTTIVSPVIFLASWLMTPDWTSGDFFGMRPVLHSLWVTIANITYFIYAVLLIFIALATIFNSDKYGYKQLLPKLALGILLVPLTWWFIQFIISLSTIVTASVINIPMETVMTYMTTSGKKDTWVDSKTIQQKYQYYSDPGQKETAAIQNSNKCPNNCLSVKDIITKGAGLYSALTIYGEGIFKISESKKLPSYADMIKTAGGVLHQTIISVLFFLVFGLLMLALIFMLILRAVKLWFYAIFSPLMTLKYVLGDGLFGGKEGGSSFDLKEFIGLAFVPALVGLALSLGLVVITALQTIPGEGNKDCTGDKIQSEEGCIIGMIGGNPSNKIIRKLTTIDNGKEDGVQRTNLTILKFGGLDFEYYGGLVGKADDAANQANSTSGAFSVVGGTFGVIIIDIIALMFIWLAFMAAKNVSKVATTAFAPFEKFGKQMAGTIKYTPIPFTGGMSASSVGKIGDQLAYLPQKRAEERLKESNIGKKLGLGDQASAADIKRLKGITDQYKDKKMNIDSTDFSNAMQITKGQMGSYDSSGELAKFLEKLGETGNKNASNIKDLVKKYWGASDEQASKIGDLIAAGHTDPHKNNELSKVLKEVSKIAGTANTGNNTSATVTATNIANTQIYKINVPGATPVQWDKAKDTLGEITKDMQNALKGISKNDFERGLKATMIDDDVKKVMSNLATKKVEFKQDSKKEEPKTS